MYSAFIFLQNAISSITALSYKKERLSKEEA